jgi:hypothetical protein
MKTILPYLLLVVLAAPAYPQDQLPIIDMHLHALPANAQGPPPLAMCTPFDPFPAWDPSQPYGAVFMAMQKLGGSACLIVGVSVAFLSEGVACCA